MYEGEKVRKRESEIGPASLSLDRLAELRRVGIDHDIFLWIESFGSEVVPNRCAGAASDGPRARIADCVGWHCQLRHVGRPTG